MLEGKRVLVTGVLTEASIAYHIARLAQDEGAELALTSFGRHLPLAAVMAKRLPVEPPLLELDVTQTAHFERLEADLRALGFDALDGVVHSIAAAAPPMFGGDFLAGAWENVSEAMQVSAYSYQALAAGTLPLLGAGASIVGLTFDSRSAWPTYDWMGVAKAALEATNRYIARDAGPRGVRTNLVSAGPLRTWAAMKIPGFEELAAGWAMRAPLGWDITDPEPVARAVVALLSDWFPATTGEIISVDGGVHAIG